MKSVLAASLGLATLASANNVYPQHPHFNYRRQNGTVTPGAGELTTLTVQQTSVRTVISCAPTVTNCPSNQASLTELASVRPEQVSTVLVTDIIQLATTICPVTEAQAVSSSVISVAATGGITGTTITGTAPGVLPTLAPSGQFPNGTQPSPPITAISPKPTGDSGDDDDEDECEPDITTEVSTSVATLTSGVPVTVTITNGNGGAEQTTTTSFTTIVTAIPVTKTVVVTESSPEATGDSDPVKGGSGVTISGTTTTTAYTTGTRTATLTSKVTSPTGDRTPVDSNGKSSGSGSGSGEGRGPEGSCVPETVTVTKEGPTVYVTIGQTTPTGASQPPLAANAAVPTAAGEAASSPSSGASTGGGNSTGGGDSSADEEDDTCEEDGEEETTPVEGEDDDTCDEEPEETVTATVVPVPTGSNGTGSAYPTGAALKNRFAKMY